MPQANLRNSGQDPYLYLEGTSGSTAVGLVGATDVFNIVVSPSASDIEPDSGTPSISIDPALSGNITIRPVLPSGDTIFANGDVQISAGNLDMTNTAITGTSGVINYGTNRFIHNKGNDNTFVGSLAGNLSATGTGNVGIGANALTSNLTADGTTAVGDNALTLFTSGIQNTAVGFGALDSLTVGNQNTAVGYQSLTSLATPGIGGGLNAAFGNASLRASVHGRFNTAIGCQSLVALNGTGINDIFNTAVGTEAGWLMTSGINNTLVGAQAGVATLLGSGLLTGDWNVIVGAHSGQTYTSSESSNILIGNEGTVGDGNTIRIGTPGAAAGQQDTCFIAGIVGTTLGAPVGPLEIDANGQIGVGSASGGFTWSVITSDQTAAVNNGYITNKASELLLALPATSAVGDIIEVTGINTALGWKVTQAANQQIFFLSANTTLGATGFIQSSSTRDSVKLVCIVADLTWQILYASGNITLS